MTLLFEITSKPNYSIAKIDILAYDLSYWEKIFNTLKPHSNTAKIHEFQTEYSPLKTRVTIYFFSSFNVCWQLFKLFTDKQEKSQFPISSDENDNSDEKDNTKFTYRDFGFGSEQEYNAFLAFQEYLDSGSELIGYTHVSYEERISAYE